MLISQTRAGEGRENVTSVLLGRGASTRRSTTGCSGRAGGGLHRLRDRPLDLVGRAEGLPRAGVDRRAAAEQVADNYLRFIKVYDDAESSARV